MQIRHFAGPVQGFRLLAFLKKGFLERAVNGFEIDRLKVSFKSLQGECGEVDL
jgi:hypothetical protein